MLASNSCCNGRPLGLCLVLHYISMASRALATVRVIRTIIVTRAHGQRCRRAFALVRSCHNPGILALLLCGFLHPGVLIDFLS